VNLETGSASGFEECTSEKRSMWRKVLAPSFCAKVIAHQCHLQKFPKVAKLVDVVPESFASKVDAECWSHLSCRERRRRSRSYCRQQKKCLDQVLVAPHTLRAAALVALVLPLIKSGLLRERLVAFNATSSGVEPMGCSVTLENK
jgi:hypothetical protein